MVLYGLVPGCLQVHLFQLLLIWFIRTVRPEHFQEVQKAKAGRLCFCVLMLVFLDFQKSLKIVIGGPIWKALA